MKLIVLLIAAWLPLLPVLFILLRSGSFGKGSLGMLLRLFFLGVAAAVPAFLMEAGALIVVTILLRLFPDVEGGGGLLLLSVILRYMVVAAVIEEAWKHFVLRVSTWKQMTMETTADGIAAAGVVSAGFAAVMYGFWQAGAVLTADMEMLHRAMPEFLTAGPVVAFLFALLYIFSHFGFAGLMGALYGIAKGSEQKSHAGRAGFMLFVSWILPVLAHGTCAALTAYGIASGHVLWVVLGLGAQTILALIIAAALSSASDADSMDTAAEDQAPVDFADSEEFADFAEAEGANLPGGSAEGIPMQGRYGQDDPVQDGGPTSNSAQDVFDTGADHADHTDHAAEDMGAAPGEYDGKYNETGSVQDDPYGGATYTKEETASPDLLFGEDISSENM